MSNDLRKLLQHILDGGYCKPAVMEELRALLAKPAEQHQGEPVAWRVQRITPTGHPRLDLPILTLTQPPIPTWAWKVEPLYIHPSPVVAFDPGCPGGDWSN